MTGNSPSHPPWRTAGAPDDRAVEELFLRVLARDVDVLDAIDRIAADIHMAGDVLTFTLDGLQSLLDPGAALSAAQFRKILYSSDLAARIRHHGGEFGIHDNTGKVAGNRYYLKATPTASAS